MEKTYVPTENELVYIHVDKLIPHKDNPRKDLGDLTELSESIKAKGVMQNLTVVPAEGGKFTVIIGHRRCAAAMLAGVDKLPCVVVEMSPRDQIATMLLENMQRSDLTVYEQARSFQLMMDLGESVETLSDKTGFSETTIRRRLKMAELDGEKLKKYSSERQLSLGDFDKLAQIESVKTRNELLAHMGTSNFDFKIRSALEAQERERVMPQVKKILSSIGATEMKNSSDRWNGKYEQIETLYLLKLKPGKKVKIPEKYRGKKILYYMYEYNSTCEIWGETEKASKPKKSQKEIDRERYIADTHAELRSLTRLAYILRYNFVMSLTFNKSNAMKVLDGAVQALMVRQIEGYMEPLGNEFYSQHLDIPAESFDCSGNRLDVIREGYQRCVNEHIGAPQIIIVYGAFRDGETKRCYSDYQKEFPRYARNRSLEGLYKWLTGMGYEMSDDEKKLLDGTHPLFVDKDAKK